MSLLEYSYLKQIISDPWNVAASKDDDDGDEEDIRDDNNDGVNDDDNISKIYGSPDRSLASLYKDHPLARTFVRACSMSPMTPELMDTLANAFANELAESAMFNILPAS